MAKVILNREFVRKQTPEIYFYKAGAKRTELKIYSYLPSEVLPANEPVSASLKLFKNYHEAIITLETETEPSDTILGVGVFKAYEISIFNENAFIFTAFSSATLEVGLLCVVKNGAIVKLHSYKNRNPASYKMFNAGKWINLGTKAEILASSTIEAELVRKTLGWDSDVVIIK